MHDELTGLPNKRYFLQRLEMALQQPSAGGGLAILFVDLNGFKAINDTHGHAMGDRYLKVIADRLNHSMRAEDMVCRLGGDEFVCLVSGIVDRRRISRIATKICAVIAAPASIGTERMNTSASIGIALSPADGTTVETLIGHADSAMYRAKQCVTRYTFYRSDDKAVTGLSAVIRSV